jgi:DNA replication protein DnaC
MSATERRDLVELLEDRYDKSSTILTTQLPMKTWHEAIGDPTIADAFCDRVVHNSHIPARPVHAPPERPQDQTDHQAAD